MALDSFGNYYADIPSVSPNSTSRAPRCSESGAGTTSTTTTQPPPELDAPGDLDWELSWNDDEDVAVATRMAEAPLEANQMAFRASLIDGDWSAPAFGELDAIEPLTINLGVVAPETNVYGQFAWANNGVVISLWSNTQTVQTPAIGLDAPPIPIALYGGRDGASDAHAGCNDFDLDHTGIAQVNVYRSATSGGPYALVGNFDLASFNELFDSGLSGSLNYYYVLRTLGDGVAYQAVESGNSAEICALLDPQNLAVDAAIGTATVTWDYDPPNPTQDFQLQYSTDEEFAGFTEILITDTALREQGLVDLTPSTPYFVRIRSRNSAGCASEWSATSFTTDDLTTAPVIGDWELWSQDTAFGIEAFGVGKPLPEINGVNVRYRLVPETEWTQDNADLDEGDELNDPGPGYTVEAQIAWVVIALSPPSNTQVSDWSDMKSVTVPP